MRCIVSSLLVSFLAFSIYPTSTYPTSASAEQIKPFTTDGCSVFPDGTFQQDTLWLGCCTAHDYTY